MKKTLLLLAALTFLPAFASVYKFGPDSGKVGFEIIKFKIGGKVPGNFKQFTSQISFDEKSNKLTKVEATIQTASIDTADEKRDGHLKSDPKFFDVANHPTMKFVSTSATTFKNDQLIKGNLTLKGITKPVELKLSEVKIKGKSITFTAKTRINRLDHDIVWNKTMEKSAWKKVFGILGKNVLDQNVDITIQGTAKTSAK
jgi:polyisoprenoid-binding protein YceI